MAFVMPWALAVAVAAAHKHCLDDYDHLQAGDSCRITWKELGRKPALLPTQPSLGYAWVHQQQATHFSSKKDAEKVLKQDQFPVVLANSSFYLTDRHHHAAALELSGDKEIFDLDLRLTVVCDLRSLGAEEFWSRMSDLHYIFLQKRASPWALPQPAAPAALPDAWHLEAFQDDVWRSLAGFADHVEDDSKRCYVKNCEDTFVDFQWGYAMNQATEYEANLWPSAAERETFRSKLHALPYPSTTADLDSWKSLGELSLALCHSQRLRDLPLPPGYGVATLRGWSSTPLPSDPKCRYESCRSAVVV